MSKKHYIAVAARIREQYTNASLEDSQAIEWLAYDLADYFASDNGAFDCERFLRACGVW